MPIKAYIIALGILMLVGFSCRVRNYSLGALKRSLSSWLTTNCGKKCAFFSSKSSLIVLENIPRKKLHVTRIAKKGSNKVGPSSCSPSPPSVENITHQTSLPPHIGGMMTPLRID